MTWQVTCVLIVFAPSKPHHIEKRLGQWTFLLGAALTQRCLTQPAFSKNSLVHLAACRCRAAVIAFFPGSVTQSICEISDLWVVLWVAKGPCYYDWY